MLENRFKLIEEVLEKRIFEVGAENGEHPSLVPSLCVKYHDNKLFFASSNRHAVPFPLGRLPLPENMGNYVSTRFVCKTT